MVVMIRTGSEEMEETKFEGREEMKSRMCAFEGARERTKRVATNVEPIEKALEDTDRCEHMHEEGDEKRHQPQADGNGRE